MIARRADRPTAITLDDDKACDAEDFVNELRSMDVTPNVHRTSAAVALRLTGERPDRGNRLMATVPGFAKDFVGRWRIVEMEVTATSSILLKRASHRRSALSTNHTVWIPASVGTTTMRHGPLRRLHRGRGLLRRDPERGNGVMLRHGRACPGHPRLSHATEAKTWMPGTRPRLSGSIFAVQGARH